MDLQKLNPWNWFKHEDQGTTDLGNIPVKRNTTDDVAAGSSAHPITQLQLEIDRLFDQALQGFGLPGLGRSMGLDQRLNGNRLAANVFRPSVNVSSDGKDYLVTVEAPGMKEGDITLDLNKDMLTIRGEKREEHEDKDRHFYRMERSYGSFQRTLSLPEDSDQDNIQARMQDGMLTITIPRRELPAGDRKRIQINS